jgi:hypothetical protein
MFAYFALLLRRERPAVMLIHLAVPVLLVAGTQFHSYGVWQKGLICYFVVVATVHDHLLRRNPARPADTTEVFSCRKVYRLTTDE